VEVRLPTRRSLKHDRSGGRICVWALVNSSTNSHRFASRRSCIHSIGTIRQKPVVVSWYGMPPMSSGACCDGMKTWAT